MSSDKRFLDVLTESQGTVTQRQFDNYVLRHMLKRISDQEYDEKCKKRFAGLTTADIEHLLLKDIIHGEENI